MTGPVCVDAVDDLVVATVDGPDPGRTDALPATPVRAGAIPLPFTDT
ncbi:hypothetical protein [Thermomonospora echinospora]|nr:hypothetical protein [Thermomonospora echinospora]